jgi:hypothetical protein
MPLQSTNFKAKKSSIDRLYEQFQMYGFTTDITYEEYAKIVDYPLSRRVIKKLFMGRWIRVMRTLERVYPDVNTAGNRIAPVVKEEETLLTIRNRWRNETADPSPDPYSGVNLATIVNKHGKGLAMGSELEKKYMRGALIEIWLQNKARGMDSSKVPVTEDIRWKAADFGDLTPEEEEHLATASESKPKSGLGFGHEQSPSDKKEKKFSGLEILRASIEAKNE